MSFDRSNKSEAAIRVLGDDVQLGVPAIAQHRHDARGDKAMVGRQDASIQLNNISPNDGGKLDGCLQKAGILVWFKSLPPKKE